MVLNSTVKSNLSIEEDEQLQSPPLVVNTSNFNNQDLEDYVNISEEIERTTRERRSQRRRCTRSNTIVATMTREEIFESTNIDDDQFLNAMEYETTYDTGKNRAELVNSIENIMKYFDEDVSVKENSSVKSSPKKKSTKGKVAAAVASMRHKCSFTPSPLNKNKIQKPEVKTHVQELKKKYDSSLEDEAANPCPETVECKSPKLSRKTKVKQMALMFNNKFSSMKRTPYAEPQTPEPVSPGMESIASPTFTSTLKQPKLPKLKTKFPTFLTKLPNPKPSPLFKRKQLQKSPSISSLTNSPLTKRKQLQKQPSTTCLVAESVFSQLTVKDKVLLYNRFISDMSKQNPKFSKQAEILESNVKKEMQRGEVVSEKQVSVKHLRDSFEAKITPGKTLSKTLKRFKKSTSKLSLDITPKSKEYEDILQADKSSFHLEDDSQDPLHVSTLTVVLKSSPEVKKYPVKTKNQRKRKDVTFVEDVNIIEPSHKRTQSMIRSSVCVEPLAPPRKIRRTRHERLAPKQFFQNPYLEQLFYQWLKEKNGVAFDIASVNNKNDIIEIVPKNSRDNVIPQQEVEQMLEMAISKFESDKENDFAEAANIDDAMVLIKNTIENEMDLEKSVVEVELPLDIEIPCAETKEIENQDCDLGLTSIAKTTSEDSQMEFKSHEVSNPSTKPFRKKKLRRSLTLKKENYVAESNTTLSTDSDSDCNKARNMKMQSFTLPKSKKCSNYMKKLIFKTNNSPVPSEQNNQLNSEISTLELDRLLISQVNSPSKIKNAYTLTIMSSPSPHSESDFYDTDLLKTPIKNETSKSWPSLLEASLNGDTNYLKEKSVSTEFTDLTKSKLAQEKLLMDSFIDQGFETGSNDYDSPSRLPRKSVLETNKPLTKWHNPKNVSTSIKNNSQQLFAARPAIVIPHDISPITSKCSSKNRHGLTMTIINEDSNMEDSEERHHTPSSLYESVLFFSQDSINNQSNYPLEMNHKVDTSQFWITSGDFTAAITIQHYDSDRLLLLSNIYAQKSLETKEMNFGIDNQKFCLDNTATPDEIIKKVPIEDNCSQYWFSTGDVLIPFKGKQMTTKKIQTFFNYIREFMEESGFLRFGIDSYEFSNIYQQTQNLITPFSANTGTQPISPLKTSDLDQSDLDSEGYEHLGQHLDSIFFNSDHLINNTQEAGFKNQLSSVSLEQIFEDARLLNLCKSPTDKQALETDFTVPEILKTLQNQQSKLKFLEQRMINCTNTKSIEINESPEYMRKLRSIIAAIDNIGQGNGFNACTIEQLESFMLFLSRYADLCLANCTAHIEKILDVVMSQRLTRL